MSEPNADYALTLNRSRGDCLISDMKLSPAQRDAIDRAKKNPYLALDALPSTTRVLRDLGLVHITHIAEGCDGPVYGWVLTEKGLRA